MRKNIGDLIINPKMDNGSVIIRRARKLHYCSGGHSGTMRTPCATPIRAGERYVEYVGESPLYSSGQRYHALCASQQGLLVKREPMGMLAGR